MSTSNLSPEENHELIKKGVHVLPKKPGQRGRTEVHCFESSDGENDACILVNVPSQSSLVSELSISPAIASDESLQAYAEKSINETKRSSTSERVLDSLQLRRSSGSDGYDKYDAIFEEESDAEQSWSENGIQEEEPLVDCNQFMHPVSFVTDMVNQICDDGAAKAETIWQSLVEVPTEKAEVPDEDEYVSWYDTTDDDDDDDDGATDNNQYYGGGYYPAYKESIEYAVIDSRRSLTSWPTIGEFTIELGAFKIDDYLSNFETEENWMYVIYYKGLIEDKCSKLHKYQAVYSLPTWKYPIAQATASIFFTIEVCKTSFPHCFVDVKFQYETFRQVYSVGTNELQEKWLHYILDSKIKFFQTITY
ncbi:unnamed protein product [Ceutorhynchus assimilis]|uniref:Uncharacterized protein n=1 Tax=Ceutorhynchus assimilis TaxID=467358 RepID=A0A9N9MHK4_9CUCU|nr:unnamed protein product [Ceutorhynchus assimilis]